MLSGVVDEQAKSRSSNKSATKKSCKDRASSKIRCCLAARLDRGRDLFVPGLERPPHFITAVALSCHLLLWYRRCLCLDLGLVIDSLYCFIALAARLWVSHH